MISLLLRWRAQSVVLLLALVAPYDGLLLVVPLPGVVGLWKEALVIGAAGLAWYQREPLEGDRRRRRPVPLWAGAVAALTLIAALSTVREGTLQSVFGFKIGYFFLLVPLAMWWAPFDRGDHDRLVTILMGNAMVTAFVGLAQQAAGPEALHAIGYEWNETIRYSGGFLRSFSTFNQPFPFGYFLATVILVGLPIALSDRHRRRNRLFLWAMPILLLGVASTVVRGAILAVLVGGVFLAVRHRVLRVAVLGLPIVFAVALAVDLSGFVSLDSMTDRVTGWTLEVVDTGVEPLGRGVGSTSAAAERFNTIGNVLPDLPLGDRYQPDNQYVKMLVELGPVGLWLFVLMLGGAISATVRAEAAATDAGRRLDADFAHGVRASFLGAMAAAMVSTYWEIYPADLYFWILLGAVSFTPHSPTLPVPTARRARGRPASSSTDSRSAPAAAASRPTVASSFASSPLGWRGG